MKSLLTLILAFVFTQISFGAEIDFLPGVLTNWPWPLELVDDTYINVPNIPPGFQATISGPITGYGSLIKTGDGCLNLAEIDIGGGIDLTAGTLTATFINCSSLTLGVGCTVVIDPRPGLPCADFSEGISAIPEPSTITLLISSISIGLFLPRKKASESSPQT